MTHMLRNIAVTLTLLLAAVFATPMAQAQTLTSVRVGLNVEGPLFVVDGTRYTTTQIFLWPLNSTHTVQFPLSADLSGATLGFQESNYHTARYTFESWKDDLG